MGIAWANDSPEAVLARQDIFDEQVTLPIADTMAAIAGDSKFI